jgi:hypothetical protein
MKTAKSQSGKPASSRADAKRQEPAPKSTPGKVTVRDPGLPPAQGLYDPGQGEGCLRGRLHRRHEEPQVALRSSDRGWGASLKNLAIAAPSGAGPH